MFIAAVVSAFIERRKLNLAHRQIENLQGLLSRVVPIPFSGVSRQIKRQMDDVASLTSVETVQYSPTEDYYVVELAWSIEPKGSVSERVLFRRIEPGRYSGEVLVNAASANIRSSGQFRTIIVQDVQSHFSQLRGKERGQR